MNQKFLPIGTVVLLKEGTKKCMITGFCVTSDEVNSKVYDYCGCIYPEGVISSNQILIFNHNQIDKIYYLGFIDEEEKQFKNKLNQVLNETVKSE